jgi:hypothetical protein
MGKRPGSSRAFSLDPTEIARGVCVISRESAESLFAHFMDARFCGDEFERGSGFASAGFPVIR